MTQRPYELLARFGANGSIAGIHVRTITTVDGRDYEGDPVPLASASDPAFAAFASQFSASAVAERDSLKMQLDTKTTELQTAENQLESVTSELAAVQADLALKVAAIADLQARFDALVNQLQFNPRHIGSVAFIARLTSDEVTNVFTSEDPNTHGIATMLATYRKNDWPIYLDDAQTQQAIGYLVQVGQITQERAKEILRDATREESHP